MESSTYSHLSMKSLFLVIGHLWLVIGHSQILNFFPDPLHLVYNYVHFRHQSKQICLIEAVELSDFLFYALNITRNNNSLG